VHPASVIRRARLLLALDTAVGAVEDQAVIAEQVGVSCETVRLVSKRFAETGGDVWATVERKKREFPPVPSQVTGEVEARLIALACSATARSLLNDLHGCAAVPSSQSPQT
jgi:transposase